MQIPDSFARTLERRLERLIALVRPEPSDHRTADLLRLARKDLRKLKSYVGKTENGVRRKAYNETQYKRL